MRSIKLKLFVRIYFSFRRYRRLTSSHANIKSNFTLASVICTKKSPFCTFCLLNQTSKNANKSEFVKPSDTDPAPQKRPPNSALQFSHSSRDLIKWSWDKILVNAFVKQFHVCFYFIFLHY